MGAIIFFFFCASIVVNFCVIVIYFSWKKSFFFGGVGGASFVAFRGQVSFFFSMAMVVVLIYTFISSGVEGRGFWGKEEFSSFYLHCSILLF